MKKTSLALALLTGALMSAFTARSAEMLIESLDGPVTKNEITAFKTFITSLPATGDNNHNNWVYGNGGKSIESAGMVFEISGDREILDQMIRFADAALTSRNDPVKGRLIWTGKRDQCWPNSPANSATAAYSGSENGDVISHISYCAKLILKNPSLWTRDVGIADTHGYGKTYKERALTYVREMDRTMDTFVVPWFVSTNGNQFRWPDTPLYTFNHGGTPIPWNQQTMLGDGFLRLAECHELLGDDAARVKKYYEIIHANMNWFLSDLHPGEKNGHPIYDWGYSSGRKSEDVPHGGYDIWGLYRAYESGKFGIPAAMMTNFANTLNFVIYDPANKAFHMRVDGVDGGKKPRASVAASWTVLSEYFPTDELYYTVGKANMAPAKTKPLEAAFILWEKNRRHLKAATVAQTP
jgi:hypothetical protein